MRDIPTPLSLKRTRSERSTEPPVEPQTVRVLVVDDEPELLRAVARILRAAGFDVATAGNGMDALERLAEQPFDVMLVDLVMPGMTGLDVLKKAKAFHGSLEVITMTAFADVDTAVAAVKAGAYDFLTKPFSSSDTVALAVTKASEHGRLLDKNRRLEEELEVRDRYGDIVGSSQPMLEVYRTIDSVSHSSSTVLIEGESGTGKELVARAVHSRGSRADRPFIPVNCSAIPENLVESELFGHVRGAFTGAVATRMGLFEAADKGTILLDEVGELPLHVQVKLLRTLQEGEVKRIGSSESIRVNVRVIAATNVDLQKAMLEGAFREDLFYRLNVISIHIPSLRERIDDIPLLAYHFLRKYALRSGRDIRSLSLEAMNALLRYGWPGNVRELENAIERSLVMARGDVILPSDLPSSVIESDDTVMPENMLYNLPFAEAKKRVIDGFEREYMSEALRRAGGNVSKAARSAALDRSNFRRIVKKYNLNDSSH